MSRDVFNVRNAIGGLMMKKTTWEIVEEKTGNLKILLLVRNVK